MNNLIRLCSGVLLSLVFSHAFADDAQLIERGRYLSTAADCAGCHNAPTGEPFAGGLGIDSPFGQIYASNITPSKTYGIGDYTEAQFARAVREGVDAHGKNLYPAMPYPSYAGIPDADIKALYAYFMNGVKPVDAATPETHLPFPFNQRIAMIGWNKLFAQGKPVADDALQSAEWNRGRYLVNVLGHCGACHTPRNFAFAEQSASPLAGGQLGGWRTPNITSDEVSGIGGWSESELVEYMRTGKVAGKGQAAGPMAEAIEKSLQYLSEADLRAMATYLKDTPAAHDPNAKKPAYAFDGRHDGGYEAELRATHQGIGTKSSTPGYPKLTSGAQLYSGNCASCHQTSGDGTQDGAFPSLTHNSTLGRDNADNLVMVILNGLHIKTGNDARLMPAFADELTDQQIAQLVNFVMSEYGNADVKIDAARVKTLRAGGDSPLPAMGEMLAIAGVVFLLVVMVLIGLRRRCRLKRRTKR
jgi:fructose 5-dehydrogenase cytochrome subunit